MFANIAAAYLHLNCIYRADLPQFAFVLQTLLIFEFVFSVIANCREKIDYHRRFAIIKTSPRRTKFLKSI